MVAKAPVAVLISGRGSNLRALAAAAEASDYPAEIRLVVSDTEGAGGLTVAAAHGIATRIVPRSAFGDRRAFEAALTTTLEEAAVARVCLAGFMRVLSAEFLHPWDGRIINVHPSLLPSFKGLDTHRRALDAGVKLHGATVHEVVAELDSGPIIAQAAVPVLPGETEERLAARVLAVEHRLYPAALAAHLGEGSPAEPDAALYSLALKPTRVLRRSEPPGQAF